MKPTATDLLHLLQANPSAHLVRAHSRLDSPDVTVSFERNTPAHQLMVPALLKHLEIFTEIRPRLLDLRAWTALTPPQNTQQWCQDEPVKLGTQIQPRRAPWVGTAGAPIAWYRENQNTLYGFLSNWHVMAMNDPSAGVTQHQPTTDYPPLGFLISHTPVSPTEVNYTDAAIASAEIDGFHTIANQILELEPLREPSHPLQIGDKVQKVGRTTGLTTGIVDAVGAAARVSYGEFTAVFADQDVVRDADHPFSAAGDSGSLIVTSCECPATPGALEPAALLFAGGGNLTIGNPIRRILDEWPLNFSF